MSNQRGIVQAEFREVDGTCFHNDCIAATYNQLVSLFGEPSEMEKCSANWVLKTKHGDVFTLYDWKPSYSAAGRPNYYVIWNIGAKTKQISRDTKWLLEELIPQRPYKDQRRKEGWI